MILIPDNEDRIFKYGILPNKLKYTIICDKKSDRSNVVMSVRTGSLYEPLEFMGLAHFLEHMLFMGSGKYKEEDYFFSKLKELGGSSNAYTDDYQTVYYFDIISLNLDKILDIFSRFFIDPLFNVNSVSREINAVNSEHMKNFNNDFWILRQFILNIAEKDNIINRFSTGSHKTLGSDINKVRNAMIEFYNKYYCANNMCLTIQSNKPINEVEKLIKECFSDIKKNPEHSLNHPIVPVKKYNYYNREYQLQTVRDINSIVYFWELPDFNKYKDNKVIDVIINAITLNCKKNLRNILIESQLVSNIDIFYLDIGLLLLSVDIIPNVNLKYAFNTINDMVRYYFNNLNTNSLNISWDDIYNYYIKSYELLYNNRVKENNLTLATNISNNMHYYDEPNIYNGNKIVIKKDNNELYKTLELICFDKANIVYTTNRKLCKKYKKDKYYDKLYNKLDNSFIPNIKNEYSFNIVINKDILNINPKLIKHLDKYNEPLKIGKRFWYGGVSKFNEPIVIGEIIIYDSKMFNNIREHLITIISVGIINYYLQLQYCNEIDFGYNTGISIINTVGCLIINIVGFNDKYIEFFNKVLENLKYIEPSNSIIENRIEQVTKDIENMDKCSPWEFTSHILSSMVHKYLFYYKDELKEVKNITIDMIKKRINNIINIKNHPITTIIYGNISSKELKKIYTYNKNLNIKIDKKPKQKMPNDITIKHPNKDELNCCISFIFSFKISNNNNLLLQAELLILNTLMERPAFDELRTKHQLGYLVACKLNLDEISYIKLSVQSTENFNKVEELMNVFINKSMLDILNNMNEDTFKQIKKSIYTNLIDKDTNLLEMSSHYINEIITQDYIFDRRKQIANKINEISLNDIKELYHSIIDKKTVIKII